MAAEKYWLQFSQGEDFQEEMELLRKGRPICKSSCLISLHPIIDQYGVLHVGGRLENAKLHYSTCHPTILSGRHKMTHLLSLLNMCVCFMLDLHLSTHH